MAARCWLIIAIKPHNWIIISPLFPQPKLFVSITYSLNYVVSHKFLGFASMLWELHCCNPPPNHLIQQFHSYMIPTSILIWQMEESIINFTMAFIEWQPWQSCSRMIFQQRQESICGDRLCFWLNRGRT